MDKPINIHKTSFEVKHHIPTKEELEPYRNSDREPSESIQKLMKGKSKEEMLLAEDNWKRYANLLIKIGNRLAGEETEKEKEIKQEQIRKKIKEDIKRQEDKRKEILNTVDKKLWKQGELF